MLVDVEIISGVVVSVTVEVCAKVVVVADGVGNAA